MIRNPLRHAAILLVLACLTFPALAVIAPGEHARFGDRVLYDPSSRAFVIAETPAELPDFDAERAAWQRFRESNGGGWQVHLDRRSGAPLLVQGSGIRWFPVDGAYPGDEALAARALDFLDRNASLFRVSASELVLNEEATAPIDEDTWIIVLDRQIDGIPVEGERFVLYVTRGNLVSFGTPRWGRAPAPVEVAFDRDVARDVLLSYMEVGPGERVREVVPASLTFVVGPDRDDVAGRYEGPVGDGYSIRLAWRFVLEVEGESGMWVGKIDAATGEVLAFYDDIRYAAVKGGVYPVSNDGAPPDGIELGGIPMPFADVTIDGSPFTAGDAGVFDCTPTGGVATTTLNGPYVRISDNCGAISESVTCEESIDLGTSGGDDCTVPAGSSAGNTHSARTNFYHLNRIKEKARHWLPSNTWLTNKLTANVNINSTCNAYWNGTVNFYRSGGGCRNTGEIAGVVNHEWGHGMDQNDGGSYDNPSEGYADVVAILQEHNSCVGRGFFESDTCSGYGDTCLSCTGIRDMDWDARQSHTPATPENFTGPNCGGGSGPCGKEVHCESYPPSEAMYDLAARDLPAAGLDPDSAWQLAEKLFYKSRQGSGGDAFNCSLPDSDGCNVGSWFNQLRNADDDDGDLDNGTPHAAAIFAAFDRHALACGRVNDASNQSTSTCPTLTAPLLEVSAGSNSASLSWNSVTDAARYTVLRNELSCDFGSVVIDTVDAPATSYTDGDLPNDTPFYFRVQAQGPSTACDGPVSNCVAVTPQPFAGSVKFDRSKYSCSSVIQITVRDANIGSATTSVEVSSDTETTPETLTLTETAPGSARYVGSITTTSGAPSNGDGLLSVANGDLLLAAYIDDDDGEGGSGLLRETTSTADCVGPVISAIETTGVTNTSATVQWSTDETSDSVLRWGEIIPPANTESETALVTGHSILLTGLQECTVYYYGVESTDFAGNVAADNRSGQYYHFETLGDFGSGLQACHAGSMALTRSTISCSDLLEMRVVDIDLNLSSTAVDTVDVTVSSASESDPETVTLTETGPNTSQFTGSIATGSGPPVPGDGVLQTSDGEPLTATYRDDDDGTGSAATTFATAVADCAGPFFSNVRVTDITDDSAIVRWNTGEPGDSVVEWGETPSLGNVASSATLTTSHSLTLEPLYECDRFYFRVRSTDTFGNERVLDKGGVPFEFNANSFPGAIFRDDFESDLGWSLDGEWEIGQPQALGTSPGDPAVAYTDTGVLGHDLSGQGANPGDFEPGTDEKATSPSIDASSLTFVELVIRRWLNNGGGGISSIDVHDGSSWGSVFADNGIPPTSESSWTLQRYDISSQASGNADLRIRFSQTGGFLPGSHDAGWNVDRMIVRDGSLPDFGACGGCGGTPTFEGLQTAVDVSGCAATGVRLQWKVAPSWGTGGAGTYAVYRGSDPGFVPSPTNLVASGIAATEYIDVSAPLDTTVYYVVRAETDETCSDGPANGGSMDDNLVRLAARDETTQPNPGDLGASLLVTDVNDAHVRLTWAGSPTAADYHVYRSTSPQGPFQLVAEPTGTVWDDVDELGDSADRYYVVRAADVCGNEGP